MSPDPMAPRVASMALSRRGALSIVAALLAAAATLRCGAGASPSLSIVPETSTAIASVPTAVVGSSTAAATMSATPTAAAPTDTPITGGPPEHVSALALGGATAVRSVPSMDAGITVRTLTERQPIVILREVRGQRWVVGDQTWAMATQDWTNLWYQIDGMYVLFGIRLRSTTGASLTPSTTRVVCDWVDVDP